MWLNPSGWVPVMPPVYTPWRIVWTHLIDPEDLFKVCDNCKATPTLLPHGPPQNKTTHVPAKPPTDHQQYIIASNQGRIYFFGEEGMKLEHAL